MQTATPAHSVWELILGIGSVLVLLLCFGWALFRSLKKSEDPAKLLFKWFLTALVMVWMVKVIIPIVASGGYVGAFVGIPWTAATGLVLAIIWRRSIAGIVADRFASLYDGGDTEPDPQAYYSIAESKRKRGRYTEAVAAIRRQLDRFPTDFTGQMFLAEIQAENLNDLPGAEITVQRLCGQHGHAPRNIAYAWNTLADWHLKYAVDRDAAREDLQRIVESLPGSEFALLAAERIAHLAGTARMLAERDRPRIHLPAGVNNIGLLQSSRHLSPAPDDRAGLAADYVRQLEENPQNTEVREKLAVVYADEFQRLDLATDQLQQLIDQPNQPARNVVRWLNLLADLQVRHGATYDTAWQTLSRIIERFPDQAAAEMARNRMDLLKLELKAKEAARSVKLGNYEQNIGLKTGPPRGN